MSQPVVVPDASVILKWVLPSADEPESDRAIALRDQWIAGRVAIVVPALWAFEVANVLAMKSGKQAEPLLSALLDLEMDEAPVREFAAAALSLCVKHDVTFYDAAYHALAQARRGTLVTADERYARTVGDPKTVQTLRRL